jgi:hypothetical protein
MARELHHISVIAFPAARGGNPWHLKLPIASYKAENFPLNINNFSLVYIASCKKALKSRRRLTLKKIVSAGKMSLNGHIGILYKTQKNCRKINQELFGVH